MNLCQRCVSAYQLCSVIFCEFQISKFEVTTALVLINYMYAVTAFLAEVSPVNKMWTWATKIEDLKPRFLEI